MEENTNARLYRISANPGRATMDDVAWLVRLARSLGGEVGELRRQLTNAEKEARQARAQATSRGGRVPR